MRLAGRVAVVSGAARGQGREHAVALAAEGADVVAFDICRPLVFPDHPGSTAGDLEDTRRLVEACGRRCLAAQADARDLAGLRTLADAAVAEFGRVDVLVVNHGIWAVARNSWELEEDSWQESIDVLLTGSWKVVKAFVPKILDGERGGSVVLTSSVNGLRAQPGAVAYVAAKHGIVGMMRTLAWELGPSGVRVNAVCPGAVPTRMAEGGAVEKQAGWYPRFAGTDRALLSAGGWVPADRIAKAVVFLACDDADRITGTHLDVDAGWMNF